MSMRWMMVQYVGNTLRLPVVNESDMGKSFGSSVLEREVKRIVVNPFSDSPQTFVPESENAKLREELANAPKCESCEAMLDCDECLRADGSHKERKRLSAENAKLRSARDVWQENDTKFRELVADMWRGAMQHMDYAERYAFADEFSDRMNELGVYVNG